MLSMNQYGMEYPFSLLVSAVLAVSPPTAMCTLSLLPDGVVRRAEKALTLCKCCSVITMMSLCFQDTNPKWNIYIYSTMRKIKSVPDKASTMRVKKVAENKK